ncbi:hypothetical protein [uncultured Sphaerochaeta sp.]|nr:hypothetical protein [uncultured Sphaerochaeta sp.]
MDPVIVNNAQAAIDMAKKYVDYIIVLGHIGLDPMVLQALPVK